MVKNSYRPTVTSKYNNTIHRTIRTTLSLASKDPSLVKIQRETYETDGLSKAEQSDAEGGSKIHSERRSKIYPERRSKIYAEGTKIYQRNNEKPKFKVGDRVRIFKYKNKFEKGYKGYWTKEIFKVIEIKETKPIMYKIQDLNNENIQGSFYAEELQRSWF